jgi:hypothetical protein
MFIKFDGIDGESVDAKHAKSIDVLAWSWGMSQSGTTHTSTGGGAGKVNVQDLSLTKYIDKSSTVLMTHCATGKHIPKAVLTVRKAGDKPLEYLVITLKDLHHQFRCVRSGLPAAGQDRRRRGWPGVLQVRHREEHGGLSVRRGNSRSCGGCRRTLAAGRGTWGCRVFQAWWFPPRACPQANGGHRSRWPSCFEAHASLMPACGRRRPRDGAANR